jgi:hypothetical protein
MSIVSYDVSYAYALYVLGKLFSDLVSENSELHVLADLTSILKTFSSPLNISIIDLKIKLLMQA